VPPMRVLAESTIKFKLRINLYFPSLTTGQLKSGTQYRITFGQGIEDDEELKVTPSTIDFTTADHQTQDYAPPGLTQLGQIAALGTGVFAVAGDGEAVPHQVRHWRYSAGHWESHGTVAPRGQNTFYGQEITKIKAFESALPGTDPNGNPAMFPLLLVATKPPRS